MKILIQGLNFSPELVGIGKYTGELAETLAAQGHQVTVITAPPYYPHWRVQEGYSAFRYQREIQGSLKTIRCPLWVPGKVSGIKRLLHLFSFALSSAPAVLHEARFHPDVFFVVAPALAAAPFTALAGKLSGAFTWLHIQDFEVDAALDLGILNNHAWLRSAAQAFERRIYRRFDRVSSISRKMVMHLVDKGVPPERTAFFPNWVDTNEIYPANGTNTYRQELGLGSDQLVALYSGSMGAKQGLEVVVEAAHQLLADTSVQFILCGEGPAKAALKSASASCPNVHFLPLQPVERLNELLNLADIHILPQKKGAADLVMPSKLLGALASGKPVIAGCLPGSELHRVVSQAGITVAPEDPSALASAVKDLAVDPSRRAELGAFGRQLVMEAYSKSAVLAQLNFEKL